MTAQQSSPKVAWNQSILTRFTLTVILLVIIMILVVGAGLIWIAFQEQEKSSYLHQTIRSEEISLIISHYFSEIVEILSTFVQSSHFSQLPEKDQREALLDLLNSGEKTIVESSILDLNGTEKIRVSRFETVQPDNLKNRSMDQIFQKAKTGQIIFSPIYISQKTGLLSIDIAIPVTDNQDRITHVLITTASVIQLWLEIQKIDMGETGYSYIVDKDGHFIAYHSISDILNKYGSPMDAIPPVRDFIHGTGENRFNRSIYAGLHGYEVIGTYSTINGTDWAVISELPTKEAYSDIYSMIQLTLLALITGIVCAGLFGYLLSHRLITPIQILTDTAAKIGTGDLQSTISGTERRDEIGVLARSFKKMQDDLNQSYANLEQKVKELSKTREELALSEEQYRTIFEHSNNALFIVEKDMIIILVNKQFEELIGYSRDEIIGVKKWTEIVHNPEDLIRMKEYFSRRIQGDNSVPSLYQFELSTRSGEVRDIMVSVTRMPGSSQILAMLVDITEQKNTEREIIQKNTDLQNAYNKLAIFEKELSESEQKYRSVVEDQTEIIARYNRDRTMIFVNKAFCTFFNVTLDEIIDNQFFIPVPDDYQDILMDQYRNLSPDNPVRSLEHPVIAPNGEIRWFHQTIRGFYGDDGSIIDYQSVARDITDSKNAREALDKARNKLNMLNSITFEDIRNYIFTLSGYLEVQKDLVSDSSVLSIFEKEQLLVRKISQSLEFARDYQDMGIKPPDWQNVLQVYLFAISHLDLTKIERIENIKGITIYADPLLEKVFYNLALNLLIHGGEQITRLNLYFQRENENLVIIFEDNGSGIPYDQKDTIFLKRDHVKKGMGLYFVSEVLGITGITIKETGIPGKGARFEIRVPQGKFRHEPVDDR